MLSLKERLKEILIRDKIIKETDLNRALEEQKKNGGELSKILVKLGLISENELTLLLSQVLGMPPIDISRFKIDPEVIKIIPLEIATTYQIMPVSKMGDTLTLAMADPLNIFAIDNVSALTGLKINPIISRAHDLAQAIDMYYAGGDTTTKFEQIIKDISDTSEMELVKDSHVDMAKTDIESLTEDAPIIKLTDTIIKQAVQAKASDVFIEPLEKKLRIRYRIDGIIREIDQMSKGLHFPIVSRIKIISNLDISEHRLPQDGRFKILVDKKRAVDFRVNVLPASFGENVVLRVLDRSSAVLDIEKLGFEKESLKKLRECSLKPHGMILSCGPTGSGKTTTLYSILKLLNSPEKNIITVEDPVEYQMEGMNQVNVRPEVGLTFSASLRSILRQDPDIIMIGEIRDFETLDIAIKSALTGHLVLSSLHTTTSAGSVIRMMNMGIEPFLICSSVLAVVAQRLLRKICDHCKESYAVSDALAKKVGLDKIHPGKKIELYRGKGCKKCFDIGYRGRVGITEILVLSPKIKDLILARAGEYKIKEAGRTEGMITMREDGMKKALEGLTSLEEVLRVTAPDDILG